MTSDLETARIVRAWLQPDVTESTDLVLATVLAQLDTTPQRGRLRLVSGARTRYQLPAVAAALVVAVAGAVALVGSWSGTSLPSRAGASGLDDAASACPSSGGAFVPGPAMAGQRTTDVAVTLSDGRVLAMDGEDPRAGFRTTAELYEPGTDAFRAVGEMPVFPHSAAVLSDDRVLIIPNRDPRAQLWDPATETFTETGRLDPRGDLAVARLVDDRVLLTGGDLRGAPTEVPLATATVWDPTSGEFRDVGTLVHPRKNHTATLLDDGRVLVVGGNDESGSIGAAELWDPESETFTAGSAMSAPRSSHKAVRLLDGRVLVVGGGHAEADPIAEAELWDPATGDFGPAGSLLAPRAASHTLTLLADGRVLVVGGYGDAFMGEPVGTAEVWDPATLTFSPAGNLLVPRDGHVAVAQPGCTVLVIGGGPDEDPTAERWVPQQD